MASIEQNRTTRPAKVGLLLPLMEKTTGMRSWAEIREMAELAESIGFDSLWVVDHFLYKLENDEPPHGVWECWSMLSALAACTKTAELGTLVLGMGFRNPSCLQRWQIPSTKAYPVFRSTWTGLRRKPSKGRRRCSRPSMRIEWLESCLKHHSG